MQGHWAAAAALLIAAGVSGARAEEYPSRTVTVIVPFAAGGPADITGRIVADIFSRHLGQKYVVENVVGAGSTSARCAPRHALGRRLHPAVRSLRHQCAGGGVLSEPRLRSAQRFRTDRALGRVSGAAGGAEEFSRQQPQANSSWCRPTASRSSMSATPALGSSLYIGCTLLQSAIGIKPAMVPFTGTAPVLNAMLGGEIDYECDPVLGTLEHVRAGTVKALAVAAKKRSPLLPDVPTSYEQGLPEFDCAPFYAVFAPSGTPKKAIESKKLADAHQYKASTRRPCKNGWPSSAPISSSRTAGDRKPWATSSAAKPRG